MRRGKGYHAEKRLELPWYREQEAFIVAEVKKFQPRKILEVGCGFGRVTRALAAAMPDTYIMASDLSGDQIRSAKAGGVPQGVHFWQHDLYSDASLPVADLALAIEVFLHHPKDAVKRFVRNLLASAPRLIHDFDPALRPTAQVAPHCFAHDYASLYAEMGLSARAVWRGEHALMIVDA